MLHLPCQMQEMHKEKLYICYKWVPTNKAHKRPAPRGKAKRAWHQQQKSKGAQNLHGPPKHMH
jgi:hypothetical protein